MISRLPPEAIRRLAVLRRRGGEPGPGEAPGVVPRAVPRAVLDVEQAIEHVIARWGGDLCGLLNAMTRGELAESAAQLGVSPSAAPVAAAPVAVAPVAAAHAPVRAPALRAALWEH